ncbi:hypothetical protein MKZ38_008455 [Zalerion maritima]|uniref:Uncharacterized protein n=1 Tax=Zalerion maritima TaxID=339359 RepID=A0AAD5WTW2_9PEZI|nr:hypothetical protein MKZ38_008455 [Zalerion maritima]
METPSRLRVQEHQLFFVALSSISSSSRIHTIFINTPAGPSIGPIDPRLAGTLSRVLSGDSEPAEGDGAKKSPGTSVPDSFGTITKRLKPTSDLVAGNSNLPVVVACLQQRQRQHHHQQQQCYPAAVAALAAPVAATAITTSTPVTVDTPRGPDGNTNEYSNRNNSQHLAHIPHPSPISTRGRTPSADSGDVVNADVHINLGSNRNLTGARAQSSQPVSISAKLGKAMRSSRGRPNKVTKPSQHQVGGQRRPNRQQQSLAHDHTAAAAALVSSVHGHQHHQQGDRTDAIMNEVDAEAEDDSPIVGQGEQQDQQPNFSSERSTAAAIAAMSEQLQNPDMGGVNVSGGMVPTSSGDLQMHPFATHPHHNPHQAPGSQYPPLPPQAQPQETMGKTTEQVARDLGYNFVVDSAMGKRLSREPGMRLAIQRRSEQVLNLGRRSNVEALFAHISGEVAPSPCKNCHKGHGPWTSGARCSFHETRNPQPHPHAAGPPLLPGESSLGFPPMTPSTGGVSATLQNLAPGIFTTEGIARYHIDRSLGEIRQADKKGRQMMLIETTAKQLALQIAQYEDILRDEQNQQNQGDSQGQQQQQGPPGMMDDQGA